MQKISCRYFLPFSTVRKYDRQTDHWTVTCRNRRTRLIAMLPNNSIIIINKPRSTGQRQRVENAYSGHKITPSPIYLVHSNIWATDSRQPVPWGLGLIRRRCVEFGKALPYGRTLKPDEWRTQSSVARFCVNLIGLYGLGAQKQSRSAQLELTTAGEIRCLSLNYRPTLYGFNKISNNNSKPPSCFRGCP